MAEGIVDLSPNPNRGDDNNNRPQEPVNPVPGQIPATQPIPYEIHQKPGRRWPMLVAFFILALIVAAAIVLAGRWVYQKVTNDSSSNKPTPTQTDKSGKKTPAAPSGSSNSGANPTPSTPATPPATPPNPDGSSTELPNTGG